MGKTREFWVYPVADNKYWRVRVIVKPSSRALLQEIDDARAFCRPIDHYKSQGREKPLKKTGWIASLYFNSKDLDMDVISHECCHAALRLSRVRREANFSHRTDHRQEYMKRPEEKFCHAQAAMVNQICAWLRTQGFEFIEL